MLCNFTAIKLIFNEASKYLLEFVNLLVIIVSVFVIESLFSTASLSSSMLEAKWIITVFQHAS